MIKRMRCKRAVYVLLNKLSVFLFSLMILLFIINFFLGPFSQSQVRKYRSQATLNMPYLITNDEVFLRDIEEAATDGNHIYELYGGANILKIYNMNGVFERAYAFDYTITNGSASLYIDDKCVYVDTTNHILYSFPNGEFGSVYASEEEKGKLTCKPLQNRVQWLPDGSSIRISWANVIHQATNGEKKILVQNPPLLIIFQHGYFIGFYALCFVLVFVLILYKRINR